MPRSTILTRALRESIQCCLAHTRTTISMARKPLCKTWGFLLVPRIPKTTSIALGVCVLVNKCIKHLLVISLMDVLPTPAKSNNVRDNAGWQVAKALPNSEDNKVTVRQASRTTALRRSRSCTSKTPASGDNVSTLNRCKFVCAWFLSQASACLRMIQLCCFVSFNRVKMQSKECGGGTLRVVVYVGEGGVSRRVDILNFEFLNGCWVLLAFFLSLVSSCFFFCSSVVGLLYVAVCCVVVFLFSCFLRLFVLSEVEVDGYVFGAESLLGLTRIQFRG
jgi:hypothetical protein